MPQLVDRDRRMMAQAWEETSIQQLVDELPDLVCRFAPDGVLLYVNASYAAFHGRRPEEMLGRRFLHFVDPAVRPAVRDALIAMRDIRPDDPVRRNTHQSVAADGRPRWHEWTDRAFFDDAGRLLGFMSVGRDLTEVLGRAWAAEQNLVQDELTGVLNRRGILSLLGDRLIHGETDVLVGFVDLDRFKQVNDRHGHRRGDELLAAVATRLAAMDGVDAVGRIGGDEFVVLVPAAAADGPGGVLARIDAVLGKQSPASVGWASPGKGQTAEDVVAAADAAMYRRKQERRRSAGEGVQPPG